MPVDQERAARLKWARKEANYESAAAAWRAFRWEGITSPTTYQQMENATRGCLNHVPRFARSFGVKDEWLRSGKGQPKDGLNLVLVIGIVGQFGLIEAKTKDKMPDALRLAEQPPSEGQFEAYAVEGDFNYPALFNGDIIYTSPPSEPEAAVDRQCVVTLADGSKRICILSRGSRIGLYLLVSINASPILDAEVVEAAPIVWIKRG